MGGGIALFVSCLFSFWIKMSQILLPHQHFVSKQNNVFFSQWRQPVDRRSAPCRKMSQLPYSLFICLYFPPNSHSQGVQNHPETRALGCWAWPILPVRRWDNFIPKMNETNFVSQNTQGKSTFLENSGIPFAWHWRKFYKRPVFSHRGQKMHSSPGRDLKPSRNKGVGLCSSTPTVVSLPLLWPQADRAF